MEKPIKPTYPACYISNKPIEYNIHRKAIDFEEKDFCTKQDVLDDILKVSENFVNELSEDIPDNAFDIKIVTSTNYDDDYDTVINCLEVVWKTKNLNYENEFNCYNNQISDYNKAIEKYKLELAKYEKDLEEYRKYRRSLNKAIDEKYQKTAKENLQKYLTKNSGNIDMNVVNKLLEKN